MSQNLPDEIQKLFTFAEENDENLRKTAINSLKKIMGDLASKQEKHEDLMNTFFLMANAKTKDQLILLIINASKRITETEAATFFSYLPETETLRFHAVSGDKADTLASAEIPLECIAGKPVKTKDAFIVNDVSTEPLFNAEMDKKSGFNTRSILCVPVFDNEENVLGVIEVLNKKEGEFNEEDVSLLSLLANNVSIAFRLFNL